MLLHLATGQTCNSWSCSKQEAPVLRAVPRARPRAPDWLLLRLLRAGSRGAQAPSAMYRHFLLASVPLQMRELCLDTHSCLSWAPSVAAALVMWWSAL